MEARIFELSLFSSCSSGCRINKQGYWVIATAVEDHRRSYLGEAAFDISHFMDADLFKKVTSLVGCIYHVPSSTTSESGHEQDWCIHEDTISHIHISDLDPSSSSSVKSTLVGTPYAKYMTRAVHIGFACLVGDSGESMVPSKHVLSILGSSTEHKPPLLVVVYPSYYFVDGIPLSFRAHMAYYNPKCEVCIVKPVSQPFLSTRCLELSINAGIDDALKVDDTVYCVFFSEEDHLAMMVEGAVSFEQNPYIDGLIARFGSSLSLNAGIAINTKGQVVGMHVCDFSIKGSNHVNLTPQSDKKKSSSIVIKEAHDSASSISSLSSSSKLECKSFQSYEGMPDDMLRHLREAFAVSDVQQKQTLQQSKIYKLGRQVHEGLLFFQKVESLELCLRGLLVYSSDCMCNTSVRRLNRRQLWHQSADSLSSTEDVVGMLDAFRDLC